MNDSAGKAAAVAYQGRFLSRSPDDLKLILIFHFVTNSAKRDRLFEQIFSLAKSIFLNGPTSASLFIFNLRFFRRECMVCSGFEPRAMHSRIHWAMDACLFEQL